VYPSIEVMDDENKSMFTFFTESSMVNLLDRLMLDKYSIEISLSYKMGISDAH
jgi:hypothetical protein